MAGISFLRGISATAVTVAGASCFIHSASGQEALRSAVEGDRAFAARQASASRPRDERMKMGPVYFQVGMGYSLEWNDNINLSDTALVSDLIHSPMVNLRASWQATKDSRLSFGVGFGYQKYMDNTDLDSLQLSPDSELAWDIPLQDFLITFYDRFSYSRDVISQGGLSGVAQFPRIDNTIGFRGRWQPSAYRFELGYGHYNFISESSDFDFLGRASEQFFGRVAYQIAQVTHAGVEVSGALTDYESPQQRDNQNISLGPFVEWQLRQAVRLSLRGGVAIYFQDAISSATATNRAETSQNPYLGLSIDHELTAHITQGIAATHETQQGINQGGGLSERSEVRYSVSWGFHRAASVSFNCFYENGTEPNAGATGSEEEYDRYGAGGGLSWNVSSHLSTSLSYRYSNRSSNVPSSGYQQNSVTWSANYQF